MHRRNFLKHATLGAGALAVPAMLLPAPVPTRRNLLLVHLQGGNDGLNTVVPFRHDLYYRQRRRLAIPPGEVIRLNDTYAFNPACRNLMQAYDKGQLLVLNGVGYRHTPASHYTACRTWDAGFQRILAGNREEGICDLGVCDETDFGNRLLHLSTRIGGQAAGGLYRITLDGFDTHQFQRLKQDRLLAVWATAMERLIRELTLTGQFDNTLILTYSEFGRALDENTKYGTEHGSTHPLFLFGSRLRQAGVIDSTPGFHPLAAHPVTDPEKILATIRQKWLYGPSTPSHAEDWI